MRLITQFSFLKSIANPIRQTMIRPRLLTLCGNMAIHPRISQGFWIKRFLQILLLNILFIIVPYDLYSQANEQLRIVAIGAHPDDADIQFGGTAALFAQKGHAVKFVSVTNGDAGHHEEGGGMLAKRRIAESQEAARRLGIDEYVVLDNHDAELRPQLHIRHQVIREIRNWNADIVISHRPNDYHPDHRNTGILVTDAAYLVIVPNVVPDTPPLESNPIFLYFQDRFRNPNPFTPHIAVDITDAFETKINGLDAHESQMYEWLPWTAGILDDVPEDSDDRVEWLKEYRARSITPEVRQSLEKWYGSERASNIQHAEAFEVAEYGSQPADEQIRKLFPMLPSE